MTTLIIGGGLSGLALAEALEARGDAYLLVEGRSRFGGRIKTEYAGNGYFDLGPAWFWPGQPRLAALIQQLNLEKFDQYATGALVYEDERGQAQRGRGFSSMQGSWRIKGGMGALVNALVDRIPIARRRLNAPVKALQQNGGLITATLDTGETLEATQVVLALAPRIADQITFTPALSPDAVTALQSVPSWMAGQAKAVAVYDTPFWREDGLSGDVQSRTGPLVEIHDASPSTGGPYALFGFVGLPAMQRSNTEALRHHIEAQLIRLFGPNAANPARLFVKDWAFDPFTATQADQAPLFAHPQYGLPRALDGLWHGSLKFAGTEVAPQFGGYLEGALEAAENTLTDLGPKT